jgi:hypothetical protein
MANIRGHLLEKFPPMTHIRITGISAVDAEKKVCNMSRLAGQLNQWANCELHLTWPSNGLARKVAQPVQATHIFVHRQKEPACQIQIFPIIKMVISINLSLPMIQKNPHLNQSKHEIKSVSKLQK